MGNRVPANEATWEKVFLTLSINQGEVKYCSVPKRSHQTDIKKIHGCLCKKHIWLMKNDLASMLSLLSGPWTEVDSREACENKSCPTLGHGVCLLAQTLSAGCLPYNISLKTSIKPRALQS